MYALSEGEHEVRLSEPRYEDLATAVYVNDKFMGHAGEFNNSTQGLKLNPGEYALKIVPASGGAGHEEKIRIEADKTTVIRVGQ